MNLGERIERDLAPEGYSKVYCDLWELIAIGIDLTHSDGHGVNNLHDQVVVEIASKDALTGGVESFDLTIKKDGNVIYEEDIFEAECTAISAWLFNKEGKLK